MAKFFTPQVRFANQEAALTLRSVQTVEQTVQVPAARSVRFSDFSGVVRAPYTVHRDSSGRTRYASRNFRRFLVPLAVAPAGAPNNGGKGANTPDRLDFE